MIGRCGDRRLGEEVIGREVVIGEDDVSAAFGACCRAIRHGQAEEAVVTPVTSHKCRQSCKGSADRAITQSQHRHEAEQDADRHQHVGPTQIPGQ